MSILLSCRCGKKLRVKDDLAGKKVKCPGCAAIVPVPKAAPPDTAEEEPIEPEPAPQPKKETGSARTEETCAFWVSPHALGGQIVALSDEALYIADFTGKEMKQSEKALAAGDAVEEVLAEAGTIIPLDSMSKVESNLHHRFIDVSWKAEGATEVTETNMMCADKDIRDDIMKNLHERLGWKREVIEFSRLKASWPPLVVIGLFGFITFCFVMVALGHDKDGGGGKVVRTNWIGAIFVWVFNTLGPVGVSVIGGTVAGILLTR